MTRTTDILIVGAGIAGLMAASELVRLDRKVTIVDKGRSVGGRLATRRMGPGRADHGAQFITARESAFIRWIDRWRTERLAYVWAHGWSDGSLGMTPTTSYPRYAVHGGMNMLAKRLATDVQEQGATIVTDTRIVAIQPGSLGWTAQDASGEAIDAPIVVLTAPVPQSLAILDAGGVPLMPGQRGALEVISYAPCLCGIVWIDGDTSLPPPGALQRREHTITWIADNRAKGISPDGCVVTLHASPVWSRTHYADSDTDLIEIFYDEVRRWLQPGASIREGQVKRWRYALPVHLHSERFMRAQGLPPLYFGGDAFGGPRVEGAVLSGLAVADAILGTA